VTLLGQVADTNIFLYLPPLVVAISLVYSGTRFESWRYILMYALRWGLYIMTFLIATWLFIYLLGTGSYLYVPIAIGGLLLFLFGGGRGKKSAPPKDPKAESTPTT
jgi:hypothetical protein